MSSAHTDLAMENLSEHTSCPGVDVHRWEENDISLSEVLIKTDAAARQLGKPRGSYLTLECPLLGEHDPHARMAVSDLLAGELTRMLEARGSGDVLVVGLGNRDVTPDALGPAAAGKILVTRHMQGIFSNSGLRSVCAVAPGVLGVTGVETMELVEGLVKKLNPAAVICIDSLAARDFCRIGCTVQLSDTGIQPGSGVGNHRKPLTRETLGVDVIAVGVPTVIYASALARDAFALLSGGDDESSHEDALAAMEHELRATRLGSLIVTPRDIDAIVKNCAGMIACGLNRALQPDLTDAEISEMMD